METLAFLLVRQLIPRNIRICCCCCGRIQSRRSETSIRDPRIMAPLILYHFTRVSCELPVVTEPTSVAGRSRLNPSATYTRRLPAPAQGLCRAAFRGSPDNPHDQSSIRFANLVDVLSQPLPVAYDRPPDCLPPTTTTAEGYTDSSY